MSFILNDKIEIIEKGKIAKGIKNFPISNNYSGWTYYSNCPESMILEALIQVGGWLLIHQSDFQHIFVPCLIHKVSFLNTFSYGTKTHLAAELIEQENDISKIKLIAEDSNKNTICAVEEVIYKRYFIIEKMKNETKKMFDYLNGTYLTYHWS